MGEATFNHYVLICGGRDFEDRAAILEVVKFLHLVYGDRLRIIHGDARGADKRAGSVAMELGIPCKAYPADWDTHGKAAGPARNRYMASLLVKWREMGHSVQIVAFPGGNGTRDMVAVGERAGIDVDRMGWE